MECCIELLVKIAPQNDFQLIIKSLHRTTCTPLLCSTLCSELNVAVVVVIKIGLNNNPDNRARGDQQALIKLHDACLGWEESGRERETSNAGSGVCGITLPSSTGHLTPEGAWTPNDFVSRKPLLFKSLKLLQRRADGWSTYLGGAVGRLHICFLLFLTPQTS